MLVDEANAQGYSFPLASKPVSIAELLARISRLANDGGKTEERGNVAGDTPRRHVQTEDAVTGRAVVIEPDVQKVIRFMAENLPVAKLIGVADAIPALARLAWGHCPQEPCVPVYLTPPANGQGS
jgi:hypothetical protein